VFRLDSEGIQLKAKRELPQKEIKSKLLLNKFSLQKISSSNKRNFHMAGKGIHSRSLICSRESPTKFTLEMQIMVLEMEFQDLEMG